MPYRFGEVVLVDFPFTDLQSVKRRPAVIISRDDYHANRPDAILMGVTSQIRQPLIPGEEILDDWQAAGLLKPSMLKPLIASVQQDRIVKSLGQLSAADLERLKSAIQAILGS